MQRILWRAARRCTNSSAAFKPPQIAQGNAVSGVHTGEASTCSNEYDDFKWTTSMASRSIQADTNRALTSKDFSYILEYCATEPDPLAIHWLTLLGEKENSHNSLPIFNIFLSGCGSTIKQSDIEWCLEKMETYLLGKSEITYCELLKLAVSQRNLSAVYDIWKDCTRNYSPSIILHRKFVRALTTLGDLRSAYRVMQHMVVLAGRSTDHLRGSSKTRHQRSRLGIPVPALTELEDLKIRLGCDPPSSFLGKVEESEKYPIDTQPELSQEENLSLENSQLQGYAKFISTGDNLSDKFELDNGRMTKQLGSIPATVKKFLRWSFNDIIHTCVQLNNCEIAEQLFLERCKRLDCNHQNLHMMVLSRLSWLGKEFHVASKWYATGSLLSIMMYPQFPQWI